MLSAFAWRWTLHNVYVGSSHVTTAVYINGICSHATHRGYVYADGAFHYIASDACLPVSGNVEFYPHGGQKGRVVLLNTAADKRGHQSGK